MRWLCCALVASVLCPIIASADGDAPKYVFKQNYRDGQEYTVLFGQSSDLTFTTYARGRAVDERSNSVVVQDKGTLTILETKDGVPVAERVEFDPSCGAVTRVNRGEPKINPSALAGRTVTVRRGKDGTPVTDLEGAKDSALRKVFRDWLSRDSDYYPDHPVQIGEKWDVSAKVKSRLAVMGERQQLIFTCTLKDVRTVKGHRLAELTLNMAAIDQMKNGINLEVQGDGRALIDLDTGRVGRVDVTGTMHASGSAGDRVNGSGDGTVEVHQLCLPAKRGIGGTAAAN